MLAKASFMRYMGQKQVALAYPCTARHWRVILGKRAHGRLAQPGLVLLVRRPLPGPGS